MKVSPLRALTLFLDSFIVMAFAKHIGSSRRTPCGRTPLAESGLAAFPHPALHMADLLSNLCVFNTFFRMAKTKTWTS